MQRRTRAGRLAVLAVLVVICSTVGAGADLTIDGLDAEGVNETFTDDAVRFQTSYMNQSLNATQVFVPDALRPNLDDVTYSLQTFNESWENVSAQLLLNIQYTTAWNERYPTTDLDAVLGGDGSDSNFTADQFALSQYSTAARPVDGRDSVFAIDFRDGPTTWNITVTSHYEHLIFTYDVIQNNTVVHTFEDVYSAETPEKIKFADADTEHILYPGQNVQEQSLTYDGLYSEAHPITVAVAIPEEDSIREVDTEGVPFERVSMDYADAKARMEKAGLSEEVILGDTAGYTLKYYNMTMPADSRKNVRVRVNTHEGGEDRIYMWMLGSAGGSTTLYETSSFSVSTIASNVGWRAISLNTDISEGTQLKIPYNSSHDGFHETSSVDQVPYQIRAKQNYYFFEASESENTTGLTLCSPNCHNTADGQWGRWEDSAYSGNGAFMTDPANEDAQKFQFLRTDIKDGTYDVFVGTRNDSGNLLNLGTSKDSLSVYNCPSGTSDNARCEIEFGTYDVTNNRFELWFDNTTTQGNRIDYIRLSPTSGNKVDLSDLPEIETSQEFFFNYSDNPYTRNNGLIDSSEDGYAEWTVDQSFVSGDEFRFGFGANITFGENGGTVNPVFKLNETVDALNFTLKGDEDRIYITDDLDNPSVEEWESPGSHPHNLTNWTDAYGDEGGQWPQRSTTYNQTGSYTALLYAFKSEGWSTSIIRYDLDKVAFDPVAVKFYYNMDRPDNEGSCIFRDVRKGFGGGGQSNVAVSSSYEANTDQDWKKTSGSGYETVELDDKEVLDFYSLMRYDNNEISCYFDDISLGKDQDPNNVNMSVGGTSVFHESSDLFGLATSDDASDHLSTGNNTFTFTADEAGSLTFAPDYVLENAQPAITSTEFIDDRKNGVTRLNSSLDDKGEADINDWMGGGSLFKFTNSTLAVDITLPHSSTYNVTDFQNVSSDNISIDISETDTGLQQDDFQAAVSEQRSNQTVTITNNGDQIDYNLTLDQYGTVIQDTWNGTIASSSTVEKTGEWSFDEVEEGNKTRNFTEIVSDETVQVTVEQPYNGTGQMPLDALNVTFNFTDQINASYWSNTTGLTYVNITRNGNGTATIVGEATPLPEIETPFCPSGYADFGTYCKQETNINGGTKYSYIQYLRPRTNDIENESVTHNISSSRFLDWSDRANVDAWVNDTQANISFTPSDNGIAVTIQDDYGNSSVHKDILYETKVEYDNTGGSDGGGDDSDDGGSGGGGGGGGGGGTTTIIQNVTGAYSWTVAAPGSGSQRFQFFGYPGRTFSAPLELENTGSRPVNLSFQCLSSDGSCQWVDLSTDHVRLDASSFTETTVVVRGQVPMNASRDEYNFVVRVTDPSFNPANPEGGGKADVRFSVDMNRPLGVLIERYSRLAGIYTTIEAPDGAPLPQDAQGVPVPFVLIPLFASGAVFAVARAVNDRTGPVLAVQILAALFVFILVTGVVPPL